MLYVQCNKESCEKAPTKNREMFNETSQKYVATNNNKSWLCCWIKTVKTPAIKSTINMFNYNNMMFLKVYCKIMLKKRKQLLFLIKFDEFLYYLVEIVAKKKRRKKNNCSFLTIKQPLV